MNSNLRSSSLYKYHVKKYYKFEKHIVFFISQVANIVITAG